MTTESSTPTTDVRLVNAPTRRAIAVSSSATAYAKNVGSMPTVLIQKPIQWWMGHGWSC
ncbi:MAG TPA: hypothetical protein VGU71_06410 [Candidatus Dormibacteraeota bacterium]|nr:hypothetical protein [Candidatus Dormibacteraeota bacterium]